MTAEERADQIARQVMEAYDLAGDKIRQAVADAAQIGLEEDFAPRAPQTQEWGFDSPQPGLTYVTTNPLLAETMKAGRPEAQLLTRVAGPWTPVEKVIEQ